MSNLPRKILAIQLRQLGDILLTTPVAREIKRQAPKAHVTFLSHPMGRLVLDGNPYIDEIFYYDPDNLRKELQLMWELRKRHFDVVFDFMNNPRSAAYALAAGGERIAFASRRRFAYTQTVAKPATLRYVVEEKFMLLERAGFAPRSVALDLPWDSTQLQPTLRMFDQSEVLASAKLRIVMSPTHRRPDRRWPVTSYQVLAERLIDDWGATIIWLWGPGEEEVAKECQRGCRRQTWLAPKTSFREMAAFLANCDLFIGNSNGPSHVAVAADIATFQLHGPTRLQSWSPMTGLHWGLEAVDDAGRRLPIDNLSVEAVMTALDERREQYRSFAAQRREAGLRLTW